MQVMHDRKKTNKQRSLKMNFKGSSTFKGSFPRLLIASLVKGSRYAGSPFGANIGI